MNKVENENETMIELRVVEGGWFNKKMWNCHDRKCINEQLLIGFAFLLTSKIFILRKWNAKVINSNSLKGVKSWQIKLDSFVVNVRS